MWRWQHSFNSLGIYSSKLPHVLAKKKAKTWGVFIHKQHQGGTVIDSASFHDYKKLFLTPIVEHCVNSEYYRAMSPLFLICFSYSWEDILPRFSYKVCWWLTKSDKKSYSNPNTRTTCWADVNRVMEMQTVVSESTWRSVSISWRAAART